MRQENTAAAAACFSQSLNLYREINDRGGLATALAGLGQTAVLQQQPDPARHHLAQALTIAAEIGYGPLLQAEPAASLADVVAGRAEAVTAVVTQLQTLPLPPTRATAVIADSRLVEPLTDREIEVLQYLAQGLTNQEIADTLVLALGTVKWYTGQIYGKLGVANRTQAIARARTLGLI